MANDKPVSTWRNVAAWSAVAACFYIPVMLVGIALVNRHALGMIFPPTQGTAQLSLVLLLTMTVVGFSNWRRPLGLRTFRNFLIQNAVAIIAFLLVIWGFSALAATSAVSVSEWVAAVTGATLIVLASVGTLVTASAHTRADLINDEVAAEDMREGGQLFRYSIVWMAACGLLLIGLSLAGPGGLLSPAIALAGALLLIAILAVLGVIVWRLSDELAHTLSHETGNMAFYLILVLGGGWTMLAHLGFLAAPAPLDWLTLFTVLMFAASFIVVGRRKLLLR